MTPTYHILGSTGLLGSAWVRFFQQHGLPFVAHTRHTWPLTQPQHWPTVTAADTLLHCAAYTRVDAAQSHPTTCFAVNTHPLPHLLALPSRLIHFSTDYVFHSPDPTQPLTESTPRAPLSQLGVYAQSKARAETHLEAAPHDRWCNVRLGWLLAPLSNPHPTFFHKLAQRTHSQKLLHIVDDQFGRPTFVTDLITWVWQHLLAPVHPYPLPPSLPPVHIPPPPHSTPAPLSGHFHAVPQGPLTTWFHLAQQFQSLLQSPPTPLPDSLRPLSHIPLYPVSTTHFAAPAPRPRAANLVSTRLLGHLPPWPDRLSALLA